MLALKTTCTLLCTALITSHVHSMGRGGDPTQAAVVDPRTQQATDVWKLAGFFPGQNVSAVQIAPSWILGAKHSTPGSGSYFANGYGTAPIAECHYIQAELPASPAHHTSTECRLERPDLALCRLAKPLAAAPTNRFPVLVEDPNVLAGGKSRQALARSLGSFLSVAYGTPDLGMPRYAWGDLLGMPLAPDVTPAGEGITKPTAYRNGGDSGSPTFWFSPKASETALVSVASCGGGIGMHHLDAYNQVKARVSAFSMTYLRWLQAKVQNMSGEQVTIRTAQEHHGQAALTPSWIQPGTLKVSGSTPNSVQLEWKAPQEHPEDVQRYLVSLQRGLQTVSGQFLSADKRSLNLLGLSTNETYTACVVPVGSGGPAPFGSVRFGDLIDRGDYANTYQDYSPSCISLPMDAAASAVVAPAISIISKNFGAIGNWPSEKITWRRPNTPALPAPVRYRVTVTADGAAPITTELDATTNTSLELTGPVRAVMGQRICATITAISRPATVGPTSPVVCATVQ